MTGQGEQRTVERRRSRRVLKWGLAVLGIYLAVALMWTVLERSLIYFPTKDGDWSPTGVSFEDARFESADGTRLHGWYMPHDQPRAVILFMHGNAGNVTHRADIVDYLRTSLRASVMIFDYRGYGRSEGRPDEAGILADARAARHWLANRAGVAEQDIVLLGRSLGGAVAVDLAARDGARALILQSTFSSMSDTAAYHYSWLPVRCLMKTRLDSASKIADYAGPLIQSHGTVDEVVPLALGRKLYDAAIAEPKLFVPLDGLGHNDFETQDYFRLLDEFLSRLGPS